MSVDVDTLDERHTTLAVPDTEVEYLFGVSSDFNSSGTGFDLVSCVYHKDAVPPPPSGIVLSSHDTARTIVTWTHVTCSEHAPFIVSYTIRWCKVDHEITIDAESCIGQNASIPAHQSALFLLDDLHDDETYSVQIRSSSSVQSGVFSDPVYVTNAKKNTEDTCRRTAYRTGDVIELCLIVVVILLCITCVASATCHFRHRIRGQNDVKLKSSKN